MPTEHVLSINEFNQPKELTGRDAVNLRLMRLLLLEPGTYPDHPNMGVGIVSKFRYMNDSSLSELSTAIGNQVSQYLPDLQGTDIGLSIENKILYISITTSDTLYEYSVNGDSLKALNLDKI